MCNALELAFSIIKSVQYVEPIASKLSITLDQTDFKYIGTGLRIETSMVSNRRYAISSPYYIKWTYDPNMDLGPKFTRLREETYTLTKNFEEKIEIYLGYTYSDLGDLDKNFEVNFIVNNMISISNCYYCPMSIEQESDRLGQ